MYNLFIALQISLNDSIDTAVAEAGELKLSFWELALKGVGL